MMSNTKIWSVVKVYKEWGEAEVLASFTKEADAWQFCVCDPDGYGRLILESTLYEREKDAKKA